MNNAYLFGYASLIIFWVISYRVTNNPWPWALAMSESKVNGELEKVYSASKTQALVWTIITLFTYVSIFGARYLASDGQNFPTLPDIPVNLLVLMGMSVTVAAGSKNVTIDYKSKGLIPEKSGGLTKNPENEADLVKTQMLIWTFVGTFVYLLSVTRYIEAGDYTVMFPDVDGALLVLMGASQGSYLGNKIVTKDLPKKPIIRSLLPLTGPPETPVAILGENFGDQQKQNFVTINDKTIRTQTDGLYEWSDTQIQITIPSDLPSGPVTINVYCDMNWAGEKKFEVE